MPGDRNRPGWLRQASANEAIGQLRQAGYFPTNVYEEGKGGAPDRKTAAKPAAKLRVRRARKQGACKITLFQRKKVKTKIMMIFTRQLATLIDAGLPLVARPQRAGETGARCCLEKDDR